MTQDEIIEMARQVGMEQDGENFFSCNHDEIDVHITDLTAFAKLVAAKEREELKNTVGLMQIEISEPPTVTKVMAVIHARSNS